MVSVPNSTHMARRVSINHTLSALPRRLDPTRLYQLSLQPLQDRKVNIGAIRHHDGGKQHQCPLNSFGCDRLGARGAREEPHRRPRRSSTVPRRDESDRTTAGERQEGRGASLDTAPNARSFMSEVWTQDHAVCRPKAVRGVALERPNKVTTRPRRGRADPRVHRRRSGGLRGQHHTRRR